MKLMSLLLSLICCAFWMNNLRARKQLHCSFCPKTKTTIKLCWLNTHKQLQVQQTKHCPVLLLQPKSNSILWTQELILLKKKSILVKQIPRSSGKQLHRCKQNKRGWPLLWFWQIDMGLSHARKPMLMSLIGPTMRKLLKDSHLSLWLQLKLRIHIPLHGGMWILS